MEGIQPPPTPIPAGAGSSSPQSQIPLIATKIQVPRRRPDLLPRPRLVNFVHSHLDRKLLLISAPAGYGKTTVLAEFAHDTDLPVCWYTLDPFDQDLRVFLEYLIASISRRFPAFGQRTRTFLRGIADPGSNLYAIAATLVQEIYDTIPEYFVLILDDHHTIENQDQINELLDLFLTYVDENCHLILASRTLPALPSLSLLVARRQAAGISADELRFTPHEIQALAQHNFGLDLTAQQTELLAQRTGGWITGLLLTAVPRWQEAQSEVPLRGRISVDLYDYLSRQVLEQQPAPLKSFLLLSSVLDELSPDLCRAVLGIDNAADLIDQVRARNLFVIEFEGDDHGLRYHDLFREFLQASFRRQDEVRFRELTLRAAEIYASQGECERAVSRYLMLRQYQPVADIVERMASQLYALGRWDTLAGWIDALPQPVREAHPNFLVHRARIHGERGEYGPALTLLEQAERAFLEQGDKARAALALAEKGSLLRFQGQYEQVLACSQQALAMIDGATPREQSAMAQAYKNIGLSQIACGQLLEGRNTLHAALNLYQKLNDVYDVAMVQHDLGLSHERAGDLDGAVTHYHAALQSWEQLGSPGPWANTLNGLGVVLYSQGRYEEALPILNQALAKAQQASDPRVQAYVWASLGDLRRDLGAYERATDAYTQALNMARTARIGFIATYALDGLGNTLRLQGRLGQARRTLLQALEQAQSNGSAYEVALCHTSLGILATSEGDLPTARRFLDEAIHYFEASGLLQELSRAYLHRGHMAFQAGQHEAALADLQRTIALCTRLGTDRFLVVDGQDLSAFLCYALKQEVGWEVLPDLLQRIEAHRAGLMASTEPTPPAEVQPSLKIYALGQALVEMEGQRVQWPIAQSRDLFFLLLQHPAGLRKEKIGEILWPNHAPQKLDGIFRSTLYRLRRALFRESVVFSDDVYRFNRSCDYWFDVEVFDGLLDEASQVARSEKRIALLEAALALYRGDYLEGIYSDWPVVERERLRARHLAVLESLAELYAGGENLRRAIELYQCLLAQDPYREAGHRQLMRCYFRLGDRAAAIRQYKTCVEILRDDLGLSPAAETEEVYLQVIR